MLFKALALASLAHFVSAQEFCTSVDETSLYDPIVVTCPAIGEFVAASFTTRLPPPTGIFLQGTSGTVYAAASHSGGADGIHLIMGRRPSACAAGDCNITKEIEEDTRFASRGALGNEDCPQVFRGAGLCAESPFVDDTGATTMFVVIVWNNGTCTGNLTIGAAVGPGPAASFRDEDDEPPTCNSPLALFDVPDSEIAYFEPEESICRLETERLFGETVTVSYFPSLQIPCPAPGKQVAAMITYRLPTMPGRFLPSTASQVSLSAFHEGSNPVAGIAVGWPAGRERECGYLAYNPVYNYFSVGEVNEYFCSGELNSPTKVCEGTSYYGYSGDLTQAVLVVYNEGGCEGSLTLEASLSEILDDDTIYDNICISGLTSICEAEFASARPVFETDPEPWDLLTDVPMTPSPTTAPAAVVEDPPVAAEMTTEAPAVAEMTTKTPVETTSSALVLPIIVTALWSFLLV